ncbi:MAG: magnesium/cobalt transporter CorA [Planctomycetaceae bacterium]|nr:magnesium/cobalt transporter CorA [Planctomycetaceae bacterium]
MKLTSQSTNRSGSHRLTELPWRLLDEARARLPFLGTALPKVSMPKPGTEPGFARKALEPSARAPESIRVTCIDYCPDSVEVQEVADIGEFLAQHRPSWSRVRWISLVGIRDVETIHAFAEKYQLHPLAVEDVVINAQRPKAEDYPGSAHQPGRLFVVGRLIELHDGHLHSHQVNFFLGRNTLVTIQETQAAVFEPVCQRIQVQGSRLRENDVSFLLYGLLDAMVDNGFPILERYSDRLEDVEEELLTHPARDTLHKVHTIKREMYLFRRAMWPMRDLIQQLQREKHECLSETTQTYFRDVYDHCVQIIDLVETYREITGAITETYISTISNRTNDVMRVLTVIGTIFIPLTFLSGVYGMNMDIPEARWHGMYAVFWLICLGLSATMIAWFRRRGWL